MELHFSRRHFLATAAALGASSAAYRLFGDRAPRALPNTPDWMGCIQPKEVHPSAELLSKVRSSVFCRNSSSAKIKMIECSAFGHSIEKIPGSNDRALVIGRDQTLLSVIDWGRGAETTVLHLPSHQRFYGHGFPVMQDATFLGQFIVTGYTLPTDKEPMKATAFIADLNSNTVSELVRFTFSHNHELASIDDKHFLTGVSGTESKGASVALVSSVNGFATKGDAAPTVLVYPSPFAPSTDRRITHQTRISDKVTAWVSFRMNSRPDGPMQFSETAILFFNQESGDISTFHFQDDLAQSELLSIAFDKDHHRLWMTFPDARKVAVLSVGELKIEKIFPFEEEPTFILINQQVPLSDTVIAGSVRQWTLIDRATLKLVHNGHLIDAPDGIRVPHISWTS